MVRFFKYQNCIFLYIIFFTIGCTGDAFYTRNKKAQHNTPTLKQVQTVIAEIPNTLYFVQNKPIMDTVLFKVILDHFIFNKHFTGPRKFRDFTLIKKHFVDTRLVEPGDFFFHFGFESRFVDISAEQQLFYTNIIHSLGATDVFIDDPSSFKADDVIYDISLGIG